MQAYANFPVSPMQADPATHHRPDLHAHAPGHAPGAADLQPDDQANPLRALLREVVREELEAELERRGDDDLRRVIRQEIATALTEALVRRP